ncbi:MAG: GTP 3',8-cyclase MoaA [Myxococcales bacterium]|nr:GTP 3',8-cyclase MoaA [Myxococcales bacterium]
MQGSSSSWRSFAGVVRVFAQIVKGNPRRNHPRSPARRALADRARADARLDARGASEQSPRMGAAPSRTDPGARGRLSLPVLQPAASSVPDGFPSPGAGVMADRFARPVRYLRVSVTDRCNFACTYCVPEDGIAHQSRADLLSFEEIERIVGVFAGIGVERVRLTGGEPTVRAHIVDLVAQLRGHVGELVMTTNGHRLVELAEPLRAAGLGGVNISLDTLDPEKFARLTGGGDLSRVVAGIDAARAAGMTVKLNAVALAGENDAELADLCRFAWDRAVELRFIEHMPLSGGALYQAARELTAATIRATLTQTFGPLAAAPRDRGAVGPARYWAVAAAPTHQVGIISAMTEHFCDDCNRVRLTADGALHACLGHDDAISLRDLVRGGGSDDDVRRAIAYALDGKRAGHDFQRTGAGAPGKHMMAIGG